MDGRSATTPTRTPREELAHLVDNGVTQETLETCHSLGKIILQKLSVTEDVPSSCLIILLQETLTQVIAEQRQQAFDKHDKILPKKSRELDSFQVAAAAELLGMTDETLFELLKENRLPFLEPDGTTWCQLLAKPDNQGPKAELQLRAALWLGSGSARTGQRWQSRVLAALERSITIYLNDRNNREHLTALVISCLEPSEATSTTPACTPLDSPIPDPPHTAVECAPQRTKPTADPQISQAIQDMATRIRRQWHEEQIYRKDNDPFLLPIRWKNAPKQYTAPAATVRGDPENNEPVTLDGTINNIVKVFRSIPSRRLVVLGSAGAGKTTLTVELLLKLLDSAEYLSDGPIPVIFNLASWNPTLQSLRDWMAERLIAEYQNLESIIKSNKTTSDQLVCNGHILPVLDGFDEIDPSLRESAIQALNYYDGAMVLTSRPQQYYVAIDAGDVVLNRAAVILLEALTIHEISNYLPLTTRPLPYEGDHYTKWDPVLTHIKSDPEDAQSLTLLAVFATPLMVSLARRIYSDTPKDPLELLDSALFPSVASLSDYLFDQLIRITYDQPLQDQVFKKYGRWRSDKAQQQLACFAVCLHFFGRRGLRVEKRLNRNWPVRAPLPLFITKILKRINRLRTLHMAKKSLPTRARFLLPTSKFLEDAYRRGVLRCSGGKYEFRHALLQDRLAYKLLSGHGKVGTRRFTFRATTDLAAELFMSGRFKEAETLLSTHLEFLLYPPWRRGWLFKKLPSEWSIEYTEHMVNWSLNVTGGGRCSGWVRL